MQTLVGQLLAAVVCLASIGGGAYAISKGQAGWGMVSIVGSLALIVGAFLGNAYFRGRVTQTPKPPVDEEFS